MEKDHEQSAEINPEPQKELETQDQFGQEISESSEEAPQEVVDWEKMTPQELATFLGLPNWVKVWLVEDKEEEEWTVTYSIPNKPDIKEDINAIRQVIKENKHLSSLCRFKYEVKENDLIIRVHQENQFSELCPIKSKLKIGKMTKEVMKTVHGVAKDYADGSSSILFSVGGITVLKKVVKVNLIHGYLQNQGKNVPQRISQHLAELLQGFVNKNPHFNNQLEKDIVIKETFEHLLGVLKVNNFLLKKIYKEHPLFLDNDEKIRLVNIVNDYNQHVFSKKFEPNLSEDVFVNVKNIFVDQTEYWAFMQRIDGSTDSTASRYNWTVNLKPEFKKLVIEFNKFMKENTKGTVALREDRFTFQLRFIRNLIYHCNDYKEECQNIFKSNNPNDIIKEVEKIFPRFVTFVYDYYKIQKTYFQAVSEGKIPEPFKFTLRNESDKAIETILMREKAVFRAFYNKVIVPESNGDNSARKKLIQLDYKVKFYLKNDEKVEDWTQLIPLNQSLRTAITKSMQENGLERDEIVRIYLTFKNILGKISNKPEFKDIEKQALEIYMEKGHQYSVYSCLNLIGESQSELEKEAKMRSTPPRRIIDISGDSVDSEEDYRYISTTRNVRFPQRMPVLPPRRLEPPPEPNIPNIRLPQSCRFYMQGKCTNFDCKFIHPKTCLAFLQGRCQNGNCPYFHVKNLCPNKYWKKCPRKKNCGKIHFPVCRELTFLESCDYGKKCNNFHPPVPICRYSVEGNCINPTCKFYHLLPFEKKFLYD